MKIFEAKQWVLDRMEQSFPYFKKHFFSLVIPYLLFQVAFIVLLGTYFFYFVISWVVGVFSSDMINVENFYYSPKIIYFIVLSFLFIVTYFLLQIPLILWTIRWVRQALLNQDVTPQENFLWAFERILSSFKTYWYIFAYICLIPAIIFILWGVLMIASMLNSNLEDFAVVWISLMIISVIVFIVFALYRWVRATFPLYTAIDKDDFTKDNFIASLKITNNNWWRIFGNFFLIGLIIGLLEWLISGLLDSLFPSSVDYSQIEYSWEIQSDNLVALLDTFSPLAQIIRWIVDQIIAVSVTIYIIIFTYIFMYRLQDESETNNDLEIVNQSDKTII